MTATAHQFAQLIYAMPYHGHEYTDQGQEAFKQRYRQRVVGNLTRRAQQLGLRLMPAPDAATA